jgi:long-subunit acyl-CoA synthetase (AMP-forming)
MNIQPLRTAAASSQSPRKIGSQEHPPNPALDQWLESSEVKTQPDFFRLAATKFADRPYIGTRVGRGKYQYLTYAQTLKKVEGFASALVDLGIEPGERVGTYMDNTAEGRITDLGALEAGCISAPLVDKLDDLKVKSTLMGSQQKVLVVDSRSRLEQVVGLETTVPQDVPEELAEPGLPHLKHIIVLDDVDTEGIETNKKLHRWSELMKSGEASLEQNKASLTERRESVAYDDIGGMVHSSGSTGLPKWIALSHGNWVSTVDGVVKKFTGDESTNVANAPAIDEVYAAAAPEGHVMGRAVANALTAVGGKIPYPGSQSNFLRDLRKIKPTVMVLSPAHYQKFYDTAEREAHKKTDRVISPNIVRTAAATIGGLLGAVGGAYVGMPLQGAGLGAGLGLAVSSGSEAGLLDSKTEEGTNRASVSKTSLVSTALGAGIGALAGALVANPIAGAAIGAAVGGSTGALAGATRFTESEAFDWAVDSAQEFYEGKASGNDSLAAGLKFAAAEKAVFPQVRAKIDRKTGGDLRYMLSGGAALGSKLESFFRGLGFKVAQGYGLSETTGPVVLGDLHTKESAAVSPAKAGLAAATIAGAAGAAVGGLFAAPVAVGVAAAVGLGAAAAWAANKFTKTEVFSEFASVGKPLAGAEMRIEPKTGEIQLRGPQVMSGGYLDKPEKTRGEFTKDGWFKTGDKGKIENGNLTITGRIKRQFKLKNGEYVNPEPIEDSIRRNRFVEDILVGPSPDNEKIGGLIVPNFQVLEEWAESRGVATDHESLAANKEVNDMYREIALDATKDLVSYERVARVAVMPHAWREDEVTAKGNFIASKVEENYKDRFDAMFS